MPPRFPENFWRDLLSRKTLEVSSVLLLLLTLLCLCCFPYLVSCWQHCWPGLACISSVWFSAAYAACSPCSLSCCVSCLQRTKWAIFVSVPIWFGYGFARNPDNLEWVKEVVSIRPPQTLQNIVSSCLVLGQR
jgi:hypothetical protein